MGRHSSSESEGEAEIAVATANLLAPRGTRRTFAPAFREEIVEALERMRASGERSRIGSFLKSRGVDHALANAWTKALRGQGVRSARIAAKNAINPKNGEYLVALLGGGPEDIHRELRAKLAPHGICLGHHREYGRSHAGRGPIPVEVDFVILLIDMLGHAPERGLILAAKRAGVPYVRSTRKMSTLLPQLIAKGLIGTGPILHDEGLDAAQRPEISVDPGTPPPAPSPVPLPPASVPIPEPLPDPDRRDAPAPLPNVQMSAPLQVSEPAPNLTDGVGENVATFLRQLRRWMPACGITEITVTRTGLMLQFESEK